VAGTFEDTNGFLPLAFERMVNANARSISNSLDASRLKLNLTQTPKVVPAADSEEFHAHKVCTDHMIVARWTSQQGWADPEMVPFAPIPF
jgi:branched-chain amino acid aminotransferase